MNGQSVFFAFLIIHILAIDETWKLLNNAKIMISFYIQQFTKNV